MLLQITPSAQRDIQRIYDYGLKNFGKRNATSYKNNILEQIKSIAEGQAQTRNREDLKDGYFDSRVGVDNIFFVILDETIIIKRVLGQKMDYERHI